MESPSSSWQQWHQIEELYIRYFAALDDGPDRQWVECFTQDGVLETPTLGILGSGHAALATWIKDYHESWNKDEQRRHVMTNLALNIQGGSATGSCYLTAWHCRAGKASLGVVGYYRDRLLNVNGAWLFSYRLVVVDGQG
ncbi:MAG TPA: nuclear transport factor 2 family protein [Candidatus Binataceae bacterium]